jgi:hypothetical protein
VVLRIQPDFPDCEAMFEVALHNARLFLSASTADNNRIGQRYAKGFTPMANKW